MAENNTQFSFAAEMSDEAINYAIALANTATAIADEEPLEDDIPADILEKAQEIADMYSRGPDAVFELEDGSLSVYADTRGCVGGTADIIQATMAKFGITKPVVIEYADTSSRMRPGEFGGGVVVVTASEQHWMDTAEWASDKIAELAAGKPVVLSVDPSQALEALSDLLGAYGVIDEMLDRFAFCGPGDMSSDEKQRQADSNAERDKVADLVNLLRQQVAEPAPLLAIVLEGGLVREVISDRPEALPFTQVAIIDYDTEGAEAGDIFLVPQADDPDAEAVGHFETTVKAGIDLGETLKRLAQK